MSLEEVVESKQGPEGGQLCQGQGRWWYGVRLETWQRKVELDCVVFLLSHSTCPEGRRSHGWSMERRGVGSPTLRGRSRVWARG